jgi:pyruvate formate-lyase activating enzyme-like uncharacterized protein
MARVNFKLKFNADDAVEATKFATEIIADFLDINESEVEDKVSTEMLVEVLEPVEDAVQLGKYTVTVSGQVKNGFIITPR